MKERRKGQAVHRGQTSQAVFLSILGNLAYINEQGQIDKIVADCKYIFIPLNLRVFFLFYSSQPNRMLRQNGANKHVFTCFQTRRTFLLKLQKV